MADFALFLSFWVHLWKSWGYFSHFSAFHRSIIWCWHLILDTIPLKCLNAGFKQFRAYSRVLGLACNVSWRNARQYYHEEYCMPETVWNLRLDTLEEWYQEANVSTILLTNRKHKNEKNIPNFSTDGLKNLEKGQN